MATVTGTPVEIIWAAATSTPAAQSVTVPSGATAAYAFGTVFGGGPGNGLLSATLNSVAADQTFEVPDEAGFVPAIWVAAWYSPSSGSQNLQVAFDGTPTEGPTTAFVCVTDSDVVAWRDADAANDTVTPQTITLTTVSGDLVLCLDSKFSTNPANEGGWTSLLLTSNNSHAGRLRSIVASSTSQAATTQDTDTSGIIAIAIPTGAGGGGGGSIILMGQACL